LPFCTQCGTSLGERDYFCGQCGARQPLAGTPREYRPGSERSGISPRAASMLCYLPFVGWIAALFVLGSRRFQKESDVRFHAFQGLYLVVGWLLIDWAPWMPWRFFPLRTILKLALVLVSIFMMLKASREERYALPLLGELAERSL
jgi:uncharacterized membrane protein